MNDHRKHNQNDFETKNTTSSGIGFDDAALPAELATPAKHTIYVLVRTDIELHHQMVQAGHAAAEAGRRFYRDGHGIASLIMLAVPDKAALFKARERLAKKGIATEMFFEPDFGIGESALGTQPLTNEQRKHLMGFPLWRAPQADAGSLAGHARMQAAPNLKHLSRHAASVLAA